MHSSWSYISMHLSFSCISISLWFSIIFSPHIFWKNIMGWLSTCSSSCSFRAVVFWFCYTHICHTCWYFYAHSISLVVGHALFTSYARLWHSSFLNSHPYLYFIFHISHCIHAHRLFYLHAVLCRFTHVMTLRVFSSFVRIISIAVKIYI